MGRRRGCSELAGRDLLLGLQGSVHALVARQQVDAVRHGRAPGRALVLLERDRLRRQLVHRERPEQARDREEEDALGDVDARADAAPGGIARQQGTCVWERRERTRHQRTSGRAPWRSLGARTPLS